MKERDDLRRRGARARARLAAAPVAGGGGRARAGVRPHARASRSRRGARSRRSPIPRWTATRCARRIPRAPRTAASRSANPRRGGPSRARSAPARRRASSPARRCRAAPTRSLIQEDAQREGDVRDRRRAGAPGRSRARTPGSTFADGDAAAARPAAGSRARDVALPRPPIGRRARVRRKPARRHPRDRRRIACGRARRSGRRRSSPPTISSSPARRGRAAARRSTSASPPTARRLRPSSIAARKQREADVLVTLGGASVGDYDLVQKALTDAGHGARLLAHRHAAGQAADVRAASARCSSLGLPGNPTSSAVCGAAVLARRCCARCSAIPHAGADASEPAGSAVDLPAPMASRQDYMRATLARDADGGWAATPSRRPGFLAGGTARAGARR